MSSPENADFIKTLDPATTALVLIDLQNGIVGMQLAPRTGPQVVEAGNKLADRFRAVKAPVFLVHVGWSKDFADALRQPVDKPSPRSPDGLPPGWSDLIDGLQKSEDIVILKRQWGAFHATELDLQLRRRGIKTIVLAGIATNMGVESTARQAWELGYNLIVAEDMTTSMSAEMHAFSMLHILPRIGIVADSADLAFA